MQEGTDKPRHKIEFVVGELVRVKEGPFTDFNGSVEDVNYERTRCGCRDDLRSSTPVELEFHRSKKPDAWGGPLAKPFASDPNV